MLLSAFLEVLLPVVVIAGSGYALGRSFTLDLRSLNRVSLYVLSPALIFVTLARIQVAGEEAIKIALTSVLLVIGMGVLTLITTRPLHPDTPTTAAMLLCTLFMNAGNFGLPTSQLAFGEEGFQRALLFFIPQTILAQVVAIPIAQAGQSNWRDTIRQIFRMPQIYAALVGVIIAASGIRLDERQDILGGLFDGFALLSEATLPFLLLLLGLQLSQGVVVEDRKLTGIAVGLRLIASPLLAYGLALLLQLEPISLKAVVLEASMPTAVNMVLYSMEFGTRPRFVAGVVVATTLLSMLTLTILLTLLR